MRITKNSPQWLNDLAKDNLEREIEMRNRQHKSNAKDMIYVYGCFTMKNTNKNMDLI